MSEMSQHVLVTGGAGYVGAALVPKILEAGHRVSVLDLYLYGRESLGAVRGNPNLKEIVGDIRNPRDLDKVLTGVDAVIHLACISNDPSFELDPKLGRSINYDAFEPLVVAAKQKGVSRFIYASSSSVYGVKAEEEVTEDLTLEPLTDYSIYKAKCEQILFRHTEKSFTCLVVRPATVCGYSPRLRLDLTVNLLSAQAFHEGRIKVFGGKQKRPNIHIDDMIRFYLASLDYDPKAIEGKIFNVGYENYSVEDIARMVQRIMGAKSQLEFVPTLDQRSYRISSQRVEAELGFRANHTVEEAVLDLRNAFESKAVPNAMSDARFYNVRTMKAMLPV